jgi:hypothetical protein
MQTILTLDDEVAAALAPAEGSRRRNPKMINDLLHRGLKNLNAPSIRGERSDRVGNERDFILS